MVPSPASVQRTRLEVPSLKLSWPRLVAIRRDLLLLVEGRDLLINIWLDGTDVYLQGVKRLPWPPARISISPSARYLLLESALGNYSQVIDADTFDPITTLSGPERVSACFASFGDNQLLIRSQGAGQFEALLPAPFVVTSLVGLEDGDGVLAVGHTFLELPSVAARLSLQQLESNAALAVKAVAEAQARSAPRIVAGSCGWEEMILLRTGPGVSSLEVSALDGSKSEVIATPPGMEDVRALMGTPRAVALVGRRRCWVLGRPGGLLHTSSCASVGLDSERGRMVVVDDDRKIEMIQLPSD
jgi:hypothetical protein